MVTSLSVYVHSGSTATNLVAGLYTDKNGHPGTLLEQGTLRSPGSGGWKKVSIPPVSINAGSKYWIALLGTGGKLWFRDAAGGTSQPSETSAQTTLSTLPSTWPAGTAYPRDRCQRMGLDTHKVDSEVVEAFVYAAIVTLIVSRRLLDALRKKCRTLAERIPEQRWAKVFVPIAPECVITHYTLGLCTALSRGHQPKCDRPSLIRAIEIRRHVHRPKTA